MINKEVSIKVPVLWGQEQQFTKSKWGCINYLVGANGTGKSLLAEQIKAKFNDNGFLSRYLNAERLIGLEKKAAGGHFGGGGLHGGFNIGNFPQYKSEAENIGLSSSAIITLKERLDIRIKIEALLSDIFNKTILLSEEGGFLKPKMQTIGGQEYHLNQHECHGLKELITMLTVLYDTSKNCIIFDEPELHLHPQFQAFLLEEIKKIAGDPLKDKSKKCFFIITHSPYFLDLQSIDDLKNILVCHFNKPPTFIDKLDQQDEYILKNFLPRFNTHHKQFFFSPNPVFVEGYTDQQIISILFEKLGINIGASGSCIVDVGGKDELGVFYKLCKHLSINCRVIADLDAILSGRLSEVICDDSYSNDYVQQAGLGNKLANVIGNLKTDLSNIINHVVSTNNSTSQYITNLKNGLSTLETDAQRLFTLLTISSNQIQLEKDMPSLTDAIKTMFGRKKQILEAFKKCNTFILERGAIEDYYAQPIMEHLNKDSKKDKLFHAEREHLLQITDKANLKSSYSELLFIITQAVPIVQVEIIKHIEFAIVEWIQKVQVGIAKKEINSKDDLMINAKVNYELYKQILELDDLIINDDYTFKCTITINSSLIPDKNQVIFAQDTIAHNFKLEIAESTI